MKILIILAIFLSVVLLIKYWHKILKMIFGKHYYSDDLLDYFDEEKKYCAVHPSNKINENLQMCKSCRCKCGKCKCRDE